MLSRKTGITAVLKEQPGGISALASSERLRFPEIPSFTGAPLLQLSAELCDVDAVFLTVLKRGTHTELCKCWMNEMNGY